MVMKKLIAEIFKNIAGNGEYFFRKLKYPSDELLVLCMHSTPLEWQSEFEKIISFLLRHFKTLDPKKLNEYFAGQLNDGPYILFTFDDGLKNNLYAAHSLEQRGLNAIFFIVPEFVQSSNQKEFYLKNIRPVTDAAFDKAEEDFTAMSFNDLHNLQNAGHEIGSHTSSHAMDLRMSDTKLFHEIIDCKIILQYELNIVPTSFCSVNNTSHSVNSEAKKLISHHYMYHFTTFPGLNRKDKNKQLIHRRNIEVNWTLGKIKFSLGQFDLVRWFASIQQFRDL